VTDLVEQLNELNWKEPVPDDLQSEVRMRFNEAIAGGPNTNGDAGPTLTVNHALDCLYATARIETLEAEITRLQGKADEGICTYCDGHGIYEGKDVVTGQSVELACQYCNETGRAQSQRELGNQPRVGMCEPKDE
jgi:hypothetical protein